jgi:hypothetical protein
MAKEPATDPRGAWTVIEELLDRGDPAFVDQLRALHDCDKLGAFAAPWYNDRRPAARRLLLDYLGRPLNAPRHEALVKRLFKLAEAAGDDEVMGRFLVLFDRSIRRVRKKSHRWDRATRKSYEVDRVTVPSGGTMPRWDRAFEDLDERKRQRYEKMRLFSPTTRAYLRRRAWRYFRKLGRQHPERYFAAVRAILPRYTDNDFADGLALIDNWGLVHILYHFSPALLSNPSGWTLVEGHSLAELEPAPIYAPLWKAGAPPLLDLLNTARSRPVRLWAVAMLKREFPKVLPSLPLEQLVAWLSHPSSEMVALAADLLKTGPGLGSVGVERLLQLLANASPETLDMLCELVGAHLKPEQVTVAQAVELARQRPQSLAALGFALLRGKKYTTKADCEALLRVADTEADRLRVEMVRWSCDVLSASPHAAQFDPRWVLEYLDNRFDEVRAEGWAWLEREPRARDDVTVWQRLIESPYDNVRLKLIEYLHARTGGATVDEKMKEPLDPELVRFLWATVLLNVNRGARNKPEVVRQLVQRLDRRPAEADRLLPLLSVALRSLRGPEFRAGLVGVVNAVRRHPEVAPLVTKMFPELRLYPENAIV